jgi:hypothetical protein
MTGNPTHRRYPSGDGQIGYSRGGFAHIARTDAGSTFDNVILQSRARFVQRIPSGCLYVSLDFAELQDGAGKPAIKLQPGDGFWVPPPAS